ncbi:Lrp/AsnC family transcriptional regulator [Candidatus Bathyarchaeota archaeon]|nr:Lrp/AsnC family transcriptional regulator [Candidatus Bathyarchaeota archaeon]
MDKINLHILNELTINSKKPFLTMAKELGVTSVTVQKRYEKMKKDGIINMATTVVDLSKLNFQGSVFLMITKSTTCASESIVKILLDTKNVFLVTEIIGDFDILAIAYFKSFKSLTELVEKIRNLSCVNHVEIALSKDTIFPVSQEQMELFI